MLDNDVSINLLSPSSVFWNGLVIELLSDWLAHAMPLKSRSLWSHVDISLLEGECIRPFDLLLS